MSPVRTVCVPWLSSQLGSSQTDEPQPDQTVDQTEPSGQGQRGERGNKRSKVRIEKTRFVLKVKLPKLNKKVTLEDKILKRWMLEPAAPRTKTAVSRGQGGAQFSVAGTGTDSNSVGGDVFSFSQRPKSKAINEKEKAKLAVLRTISKVLEENQLIRQRLTALSQANW